MSDDGESLSGDDQSWSGYRFLRAGWYKRGNLGTVVLVILHHASNIYERLLC